MEKEIKIWSWTIIWFNWKWWESAGKVCTWKTKLSASVAYEALKARFENVYVFDPDGDFIDLCEL
jgi:hypothetical protein